MYDVITLGDSCRDVFLQIDEENVQFFCELKREECQICFDYADKIPVKSKAEALGGNAANVAVGFARMGFQTAIYTHVGTDHAGGQVFAEFEREGISTKYIERDRNTATNYNTVINVHGERTILAYHHKRKYDWPNHAANTKVLYLTSMKDGFQVILEDLLRYQAKHEPLLVFQPGTYQIRMGFEPMRAVLEQTHLLIMNKEEAAHYLGLEHALEISEMLEKLHKLGPKNIIITDGSNGSYAFDGKQNLFLPIVEDLLRIEATGAGDAFAMGTTCGLIEGLELGQAMRYGQIQAGSVIQKIGAQAGILRRAQLEEMLSGYPNLQPQIIS